MRIGQLARMSGVEVATIRFYEQEGLLAEPTRTPSGYRQYDAGHAEVLQFIRRCRSLDMSLAEIRSLLGHQQEPDRNCDDINSMIAAHIDQVAQRIEQLQHLQQQLLTLQERCGGHRKSGNCGILRTLGALPGNFAKNAECLAQPATAAQ